MGGYREDRGDPDSGPPFFTGVISFQVCSSSECTKIRYWSAVHGTVPELTTWEGNTTSIFPSPLDAFGVSISAPAVSRFTLDLDPTCRKFWIHPCNSLQTRPVVFLEALMFISIGLLYGNTLWEYAMNAIVKLSIKKTGAMPFLVPRLSAQGPNAGYTIWVDVHVVE